MLKSRQEHLSAQNQRRHFLLRFKNGLNNAIHIRRYSLILIASIVLLIGSYLYLWNIACSEGTTVLMRMHSELRLRTIQIISPVLIVTLIIRIGTPWGAGKISDNLHRSGVVNSVEEPPILLGSKLDPTNSNVQVMTFQAIGIPFDLWKNNQLAVESALNAYVVQIQEGRRRNEVLLYTVKSEGDFPDVVRWRDSFLSPYPATLVLGVTVAGTPVTLNLNQIPHALIGGSTGSGKSVLMGLMLLQTLQKGMELHIVDFKGGLDYNGTPWKGSCDVLTTIEETTACLDKIVDELQHRKVLLFNAEVHNITEYNKKSETKLRRIIIGCDEIAELTDKTGITNKVAKENIDHVIAQLSTIARLGRAFGIHLILATQRPDANILPGQIKNNIDFRACGRADNTLATIILDNADAADMLPKDGHRFMLADRTIFLPYYWEK